MSQLIKDMLQDLYDNGYELSEILDSVCKVLEKYFENQDRLKEYRSCSELLSAFEFEIRYSYEPEFSEGILTILNCYRDAYKVSPEETLKIFISTLAETSEKENQMWTVLTNTPTINAPQGVGEDIYDSIFSYMKHIGDTLEISVKYIVQELYAMIRLSKRQSIDYEKIRVCDFGVTINNILDAGYFGSLLKTKPIDIKLSDWRNIAYHHSYTIKTNIITCSYGRPVKQFNVTDNEFLDYCHQIIRSGNAFNIARCIFAFDNIKELASFRGKDSCGTLFRKPLLIEQLKISFLSQGFLVDSFVEDEKEVVVSLLDLMNNGSISLEELKKRQIHASQLLYKIWCVFKKSLVTIAYCDRDRQKIMYLSVDENICNDINSGKPISDMVKHVKFKHPAHS